jgi:general secretion pathway protein I
LFQAMFFDRPCEDLDSGAGFTLIEALVALAVTAISLTAIGSLIAANVRGSGRIEQHLGLVQTLRAVETGLPDRTSLSIGTLSGEMHGQAWSVDIAPFNLEQPRALESKAIVTGEQSQPVAILQIQGGVNPRAGKVWTPQTIVIKVQSPSGAVLQLETIRLTRRTGTQ